MAKIILPDTKKEETSKEKAISDYFEANPWLVTVDLNYTIEAYRYVQEALELIYDYDFNAIDKKEENPAEQCHIKALDKLNLAIINLNKTVGLSRRVY